MDSNYLIQKPLHKDYDKYIPVDKQRQLPKEKSCHSIDNNILIFLDHRLVERFGIEDGTQFEQVLTNDGILLRKID